MKNYNSSVAIAQLSAVLILTVLSSTSYAQGLFGPEANIIYGGQTAEQAGIRPASWGSGSYEISTTNTYSGNNSLKITPKGLYAGGRIDFITPKDLTTSFSNPDEYLQLVVRFADAQPVDTWTMGLGLPGMMGTQGGGTASGTGKAVRNVQLMLQLDGNKTIERQAPLSNYEIAEDGWMVISFPFTVLKGAAELPSYKVKRIVVTGDGTEPFYLGEIRTVKDTTPLQANAGEDKEVSKNYKVLFQGLCTAGASAIKYSWDFDDSDGIQEEGVGQVVYHRFLKESQPNKDYTVTLTVSDIFGIKKSAVSTIKVKVNE